MALTLKLTSRESELVCLRSRLCQPSAIRPSLLIANCVRKYIGGVWGRIVSSFADNLHDNANWANVPALRNVVKIAPRDICG